LNGRGRPEAPASNRIHGGVWRVEKRLVIAVITGTSGVERVKGATMKRLLCVLLVVIFAVSFVGCKKEADKKTGGDNTTTAPK
jgi:hypothetical protein